MTAARSPLFGWIRWPPADLLALVALIILANVSVFHPAVSGSPVRIPTGLLFALFVPGYALVSAWFPAAGRARERGRTETERGPGGTSRASDRRFPDRFRGIDRWERIGLSVALSLAVVPLLALALTLSLPSLTTFSLFMTISAFTVLCVLIAAKRRWSLPPRRRFRLSVVDRLANVRRSFSEEDSGAEMVLNVVLVAAILLAVGTFGFAVASPPDGETYTEFYLVSEDEDGEYVAAEYPDLITVGEPQQIHTGIENYEGNALDYEVVVQLQRVEGSGQGVTVVERHEVDRFSVSIAPDERRITERNLTVSDELTGSDLRLEFLLYRDSAPESPIRETAYRELHIWIDVQPDDPTSPTTVN